MPLKLLCAALFFASITWLAPPAMWMNQADAAPAPAAKASAPKTASKKSAPAQEIQLMADPSLSVPLTLLARRYSRDHNIPVGVSFASSDEQLQHIEQGTQADIFISTRRDVLQQMQNQGLLDIYSRVELMKNRLCMVTYENNRFQMILIPKLPLAEILERVDGTFTFAMPDPKTMDYAVPSMEALMNHELATSLEPYFRFFTSAHDMQQVLSQPGGYGMMLLTDAELAPGIKILGTFPETAHQPIIYQGYVVAGDNMKAARGFLKYLANPESMKLFAQYGFQPLRTESSDSGHLARGSVASESVHPL